MTDQELQQRLDANEAVLKQAMALFQQPQQAASTPTATSSAQGISLNESLVAKLAEVQALEEQLAALNDPNYALKRDIARVADLKSFIAIANATRRGTIRGEEMLARQKSFHFSPYLR